MAKSKKSEKPAKSEKSPQVARTIRDLAAAVGTTRQTIDRWLLAGCPRLEGGGYDVGAVKRWAKKKGLEPGRPGRPTDLARALGKLAADEDDDQGDVEPAPPIDELVGVPPGAGDSPAALQVKARLARARREHFAADQAELAYQREAALVVSRAEIEEWHAEEKARARALLEVPEDLCRDLAKVTDPIRTRAVLDAWVRARLAEVARVD